MTILIRTELSTHAIDGAYHVITNKNNFGDTQHYYNGKLISSSAGPAIFNTDKPEQGEYFYDGICYGHDKAAWVIAKQHYYKLAENGSKRVWFKNGINGFHRDGDLPAIEWAASSNKEYYKNGILHRDAGPASIHGEEKKWYMNGKILRIEYSPGDIDHLDENGNLHREDGPAAEFANGDFCYYKHGLLHRLDGPARRSDGAEQYYIDGDHLTKEEFNERTAKITNSPAADATSSSNVNITLTVDVPYKLYPEVKYHSSITNANNNLLTSKAMTTNTNIDSTSPKDTQNSYQVYTYIYDIYGRDLEDITYNIDINVPKTSFSISAIKLAIADKVNQLSKLGPTEFKSFYSTDPRATIVFCSQSGPLSEESVYKGAWLTYVIDPETKIVVYDLENSADILKRAHDDAKQYNQDKHKKMESSADSQASNSGGWGLMAIALLAAAVVGGRSAKSSNKASKLQKQMVEQQRV